MTFFDSHLHFDTFVEEGRVADILDRATVAGVERMAAIGGSEEANTTARRLAREQPDRIVATVGMDRDMAGQAYDEGALRQSARAAEVAAIGETGLDYHYSADTRAQQLDLFEAMLALALETVKPVVVHTREAEEDTLGCLHSYAGAWPVDSDRPGVIHCFTGQTAFARRLVDLGFYISFSGILTFKNAENLRKAAADLPLDRILIETDAPYLAPVPHRGKSNEPAWVCHVAECLAEVRGESLEEVARQTTENAAHLFSGSADEE